MSDPESHSDAWAAWVEGLERLAPPAAPIATADIVQVVRDGRDGADAMELLRYLIRWEVMHEDLDYLFEDLPSHLRPLADRLIEEACE